MFKLFHSGQSTKYKQSIWRSKVGKKTAIAISCLMLCSAQSMQRPSCTQRAFNTLRACVRTLFFPLVQAPQNFTKLMLMCQDGSVAIIEDILAGNSYWLIPVHLPNKTTRYERFTQRDLNTLCAGKQAYFINNGTKFGVRLEKIKDHDNNTYQKNGALLHRIVLTDKPQ